jgi:hypothetical protein
MRNVYKTLYNGVATTLLYDKTIRQLFQVNIEGIPRRTTQDRPLFTKTYFTRTLSILTLNIIATMTSIELIADFETTRDELLKLASSALETGKALHIEIPIEGELYYTDSEELALEFLYAAYIGETIAAACSSFKCTADYGLIEFFALPIDAEKFTSLLWDSIAGFMSEELLDEEGIDDIHVAEIRTMGEDLIDSPELVKYTGEAVELAREVLAMREEEDEEDASKH